MPEREDLAQSVGPPLKILFIEDQHADFMLAYRYLIRQGLDCQCVRVDSTEALVDALDGAKWDLVLADCSLPRFDVSDALRMLRERALDVPFILLSGVIGEEDAVDLLKAGAEDFVSKDNLSRLVPAIRRGMREAAEREESREAQRRLSTLLGSLPGMAFRCRNDRAWTMEFVSEGCRDLLGYPPADLLGNQRIAYGDIICPADRELVWNAVQQAGRKGEPYRIEYRLIRGDGATRWVWEQGRLVSSPDDEPRCIEGFIMDVTERHAALSELARSEERFKLAIEGASEGLWDWNIVTDSVYYSPRWKSMLGCAQTRLGDRLAEWKSRMHPDDLGALEQAIEACLQGETEQFERVFRLRHERGHYLWVWSRGRLIRGADGAPARLTGVQVDISERVKLEQALLNTLRAMQTLGQCNAAIARAGQRTELLQAVCGILTRVGQFELAWVEAPVDAASGALRVQAHAYRKRRFACQLPLADQGRDGGAALAHEVLRTGDSVYIRSAAGHRRFQTWRELIEEQGDFSYLALPIKSARNTVAVLNLCTWSADNLDEYQQGPWLELADNLSFGLQALSTRAERDRAARTLRASLFQTIEAIALSVEMRDPDTAGHQRRVARLAVAIATRMGLSEDTQTAVRLGGLIHDIGKLRVPAEFLARPGERREEEYRVIQTHAREGFEIMRGVSLPWPVADMVLQHHERIDGSGYPDGLVGGQILLEARILAVADVVEAMSADRPYRPGLGMSAALREIAQGRGRLYDEQVAEACLCLFEEHGFSFAASD